MSENSGAGLRLVIRSEADGAEVYGVPAYSSEPAFVSKLVADIRASLRDGFYLDYPEGSGKQQPAAPGERP
jgi:hypothetical protein